MGKLNWLLVFWAGTALAVENQLVVYTSFYPIAYFAERIAGDSVRVVNPLPENEDPIFWEPTKEILSEYQKADLILLNGAGFEKWVEYVTLPEDRIVYTANVFKDKFLKYENVVTHSHGGGKSHSHEGLDGHTWLDPVNASAQAKKIMVSMIRKSPRLAPVFQEGYQQLDRDLKALDSLFKTLHSADFKPVLYASHPAYNYLAARYGWDIVNMDLNSTEVPTGKELNKLMMQMVKKPGKFLVWESPPSPEVEKKIKQTTGLTSVVFSPCENLTNGEQNEGQDYLKIMRANIENIRPAFKQN